MNTRIVMLLLIAVSAFALIAGCTQQVPPAGTTPTTQPPATGVITTTAQVTIPEVGVGTPGPTQTLPPQYDVTFQITTNGNTVDPITYVALMGGNGMNFIGLVEVNLTTPDGKVQAATMSPPFSKGQKVQFPCSTVKNRVEIWVTAPDVGRVKTTDEVVAFKSLNP